MKYSPGTTLMFEYSRRGESPKLVSVIDWDEVTECYLVRFEDHPQNVDLVGPDRLREPYPLELAMMELED